MSEAGAGAALPPWRQELARALHRNRADRASRYLQLANVQGDGRPANRTVVFRGFDDGSRLLVVTDARSAKAPALAVRPHVALCWYFAKTREQFRLDGSAELIDAAEADAALRAARAQAWEHLSESARAQFVWPTPGAAFEPEGAVEQFPSKVPLATAPECFLLLRINVYGVDHLELRGSPQLRTRYARQQDGWDRLTVNP